MGGAQAVFDVPEVCLVDEDGTADSNEFRRVVAHIRGPRPEVVGVPRLRGCLCECTRGADVSKTPIGAVVPDTSVAVDLVGLFGISGGQRDEDESVGASDSFHNNMLGESQWGAKVIWGIFCDFFLSSKLGRYGSSPYLAAAFPS